MMVEFKINPSISDEISSLGGNGNKVNADTVSITTDGVSTLKSSVKFVEEDKAILQLLELYKKLITKEVEDLNELVSSAQLLDENIAKSMK